MNRQRHIILLVLLSVITVAGWTQVNFRTIAPQEPIMSGESFEIQYVVEGEEKIEALTPPPFTGFRFVTGPHVYKGSIIDLNIARPLVNTVYTLAALKPGKYFIPGAKVNVNGSSLNSNDVFIQVISREEAFKINKRKDGSFYKNSEYFLQPGEDPIQKIRKNLFMKVMVDKKSCYVGEPVVATYKLYSRLESKSDIVKNPGFYGFAVLDMVNLNDHAQTIETINGKTFDVHTIRRVQLYPLQSGQYVIDPMEISNKVEFSRSEVNRKTEQEIVEGLLGNNGNEPGHNNTEVYESALKTDPVPVTVRPLPAKNKTDSFTAAVGNFSIKAELLKPGIKKNEQGSIIISVSGKGNFTQINAPEIKWPAGIDGFDPVIKDSIDRLQVPIAGTRTFQYRFVSDKPGTYEIEAIEFNFFNLDTNHFEKLVTKPFVIQVSYQDHLTEKNGALIQNRLFRSGKWYWWAGGMLIVLALTSILFIRKRKNRNITVEQVDDLQEPPLLIEELFLVPQIMLATDDHNFYYELNKAIWKYFNQKLSLTGSQMSKPVLRSLLENRNIDSGRIALLLGVLHDCETGMYTASSAEETREQLLEKGKALLKEINERLT